MKVMCVAGARPNFVKVKPILDALESSNIEAVFVHTGQHYDDVLDRVIFRDIGLRPPDHELGVGSGSHAEQVARVMLGLEPLVEAHRPEVLVVVGDVNSTMAAALVGAKADVLVAHVEAGLRSGDWSMPEEVNRVVTDRVSDILFAPSDDAVVNLVAEGVDERRVAMVGNVMVDTLLACIDSARARTVLDDLALARRGYVLATLHRPSTVNQPDVLSGVLDALEEVAGQVPVVLPAHPRTARAIAALERSGAVRVVPAFGYLDFVALEDAAAAVVTDSGGVQEETTVLGIPCVTVRSTTERPVTVEIGTNEVVGVDRAAVVAGVGRALAGRPGASIPPLWDGRAAERIVRSLHDRLAPS